MIVLLDVQRSKKHEISDYELLEWEAETVSVADNGAHSMYGTTTTAVGHRNLSFPRLQNPHSRLFAH